jgi:hypothetical protein
MLIEQSNSPILNSCEKPLLVSVFSDNFSARVSVEIY